MKKQKVQISLTANLKYSGLVRHFTENVLEAAKFPKIWCSRLKLVVDELFMNAVRYGSTEDQSLVYLSFEYDEGQLECVIEDDGTGGRTVEAMKLKEIIRQNEQNHDLTRTSGRGLSMITKEWTDSFDVGKSSFGGLALRFVKKLENAKIPPQKPLLMPAPGFIPKLVQDSENRAVSSSSPHGPSFELKLSGEIDQSNIQSKLSPIQDKIETMPEGSVLILDFQDLNYINSLFVGSLAAMYRALQAKGGRILLKNVNEQIKEVLSLVGIQSVLEIDNS